MVVLDDRMKVGSWESYVIMACWLDPRFSRFKMIPDPDERKDAIDMCERAATMYVNKTTEPRKPGRDAFLFENDGRDDDPIENEVALYSKLVIQEKGDFDVLAFWKGQQATLPKLSNYAKRYLSIPVSSASSERVFSASNLVCSKLRSRLTSERAKPLTYIAVNESIQKSQPTKDDKREKYIKNQFMEG